MYKNRLMEDIWEYMEPLTQNCELESRLDEPDYSVKDLVKSAIDCNPECEVDSKTAMKEMSLWNKTFAKFVDMSSAVFFSRAESREKRTPRRRIDLRTKRVFVGDYYKNPDIEIIYDYNKLNQKVEACMCMKNYSREAYDSVLIHRKGTQNVGVIKNWGCGSYIPKRDALYSGMFTTYNYEFSLRVYSEVDRWFLDPKLVMLTRNMRNHDNKKWE